MEARTPAPSDHPHDPAPHDPGRDHHDKAGALARVGAVILALILAFVTAVMVIAMLDISDTDTCADVISGIGEYNDDGKCYDGSDSNKTISVVLGLAGAAFAGLATLLALAFAIRGRGGRPLVGAIVIGAILIALSLIIG